MLISPRRLSSTAVTQCFGVSVHCGLVVVLKTGKPNSSAAPSPSLISSVFCVSLSQSSSASQSLQVYRLLFWERQDVEVAPGLRLLSPATSSSPSPRGPCPKCQDSGSPGFCRFQPFPSSPSGRTLGPRSGTPPPRRPPPCNPSDLPEMDAVIAAPTSRHPGPPLCAPGEVPAPQPAQSFKTLPGRARASWPPALILALPPWRVTGR